MIVDDLTTVLASGARLAVPLLFAACGEYVAERAGTLNISVEGMLLGGAYSGALVTAGSGSASLGLLAGIAAGLAVALVHATLSHRLAANTFVVGLTLNVLVLGLTSYLAQGQSLRPGVMTPTALPLLSVVPVLGNPLFDQPWPAYLLYAIVPATWYLVQRSRFGLEVRAAGEGPEAADTTGVLVNARRRQALLLAGALSGLGGAYLAVAEVGAFNPGMTAGRGFIVIAAVIFGGWTLRGTVAGCLLFGTADALRLALPALGQNLTPELLIAAPYLLALLAMTVFTRRNRRPAALARPFRDGIAGP